MTREAKDILYNTLDTIIQTNQVEEEIMQSDITDHDQLVETEVEQYIQTLMEELV